jgi:hypothetical protein
LARTAYVAPAPSPAHRFAKATRKSELVVGQVELTTRLAPGLHLRGTLVAQSERGFDGLFEITQFCGVACDGVFWVHRRSYSATRNANITTRF